MAAAPTAKVGEWVLTADSATSDGHKLTGELRLNCQEVNAKIQLIHKGAIIAHVGLGRMASTRLDKFKRECAALGWTIVQ